MIQPPSFAHAEIADQQKITRREKFRTRTGEIAECFQDPPSAQVITSRKYGKPGFAS